MYARQRNYKMMLYEINGVNFGIRENEREYPAYDIYLLKSACMRNLETPPVTIVHW